jgi:T4-like virus Myoviridae tail sheath stabiliser
MTDISLQNFYYGRQLRRYIIQYMAIFSGLQVQIGKNGFNSQTNLIQVPIAYGSRDRVVAAIQAENTQNKPIRVPMLSANMIGIDLDPTLRVGVGTEKNDVYLPLGETLPDGLKVINKYRPIPYRMRMETVVYASNTDQHFQMLEQILMLFDPILEIQLDDAFNDWTKLTQVELEAIGFDETYPAGNDRRIITSTLAFSMPIQLTPPFNLNQNYIKSIQLRLAILANDETIQDFEAGNYSASDIVATETLDVHNLNIPPT